MNRRRGSKSTNRSIRWSARARADVIGIRNFIARDNTVAARRWAAQLIEAVEKAAEMPRMGRKVPEFQREDIREVIRGNYRVVYSIGKRTISVLTIFEGHRLFPDGIVEPE